jgi:two-component system, OmpR family, sensor histidine kinase KdpD
MAEQPKTAQPSVPASASSANNRGETANAANLLRDMLRARRGRHKIYIGAAPGVGKTYRALEELKERHGNGSDAIIGYLETHGRADVRELAEGLEVFPRCELLVNGTTKLEMDLEGLLKRKPQWVLVDELQHSNAAGSKHKRRFIDVDELLNAGINVISTLNVQHLESLNDIVERLTGVRVRERIPDRVVVDADELVLIDISPEQLQERLKAGKIVAPDRVEQALEGLFTEETLNVLRELAMREVANVVEEAPAATETLGRGTKECIAVAVSVNGDAQRLIRRGSRVAQRLRADFLVVHIETHPYSDEEQQVVAGLETLTHSLGGDFHLIQERNITDALVSFIRKEDVTQVLLGESHRSRFEEFVRGSIIHEVMRRTHDVDVYVIADDR